MRRKPLPLSVEPNLAGVQVLDVVSIHPSIGTFFAFAQSCAILRNCFFSLDLRRRPS